MNDKYSFIEDNIIDVRQRIKNAAERSGRNVEDINLIAVTKTVEPERIIKALDKGISLAGENRVQELLEKYDIIKGGINWHLIGHLQTNKVKYIIDKVKLIHSVDSIELAREIQSRAQKIGRVQDILLQVNVSGEETKFGIHPHEVRENILNISKLSNVKLKGLMTIAPNTENKDEIRSVFRNLYKIFIDIKQENIDNIDMDTLSMGMSHDYEIAVEEGSTMLRIGSAIFGSRK